MNRRRSKIEKMSRARRSALLADVFEARRDLSGLAEEHRLSPDDLAEWIGREENQRCLTGLCLLADLQTQLMLSRYRQVAVTELIKQASGEGSDDASGGGSGGAGVSIEQSRKACVDLLKADLKRAEAGLGGSTVDKNGELSAMQEVSSIRAALFNDADA